MPWTKDTLKEAEDALIEAHARTFIIGEMRRKFRPILHQLVYDAVAHLHSNVTYLVGVANEMGIDLKLIGQTPVSDPRD